MQSNFEHTVIGLVQRYDFNPSRLILEITENIALNNCASMIEKCISCLSMVFSFHLMTLVQVFILKLFTKMPIKQIKIDRSFVQAALDDKRSNKLVRVLLKLA